MFFLLTAIGHPLSWHHCGEEDPPLFPSILHAATSAPVRLLQVFFRSWLKTLPMSPGISPSNSFTVFSSSSPVVLVSFTADTAFFLVALVERCCHGGSSQEGQCCGTNWKGSRLLLNLHPCFLHASVLFGISPITILMWSRNAWLLQSDRVATWNEADWCKMELKENERNNFYKRFWRKPPWESREASIHHWKAQGCRHLYTNLLSTLKERFICTV